MKSTSLAYRELRIRGVETFIMTVGKKCAEVRDSNKIIQICWAGSVLIAVQSACVCECMRVCVCGNVGSI